MKIFLLVLSTVVLAAGEGQTKCSMNEIFLSARGTCAERCTANQNTCGGGECEVLPGGGTGVRDCICKPGFVNGGSSKAMCLVDCGTVVGCQAAGGRCDAPGVCNCASPGNYFTNRQCTPKPECNGDCYGKICDASGCNCAPGFYELVDGKCKPTCAGKCDAARGLECVDPQVCSCIDKTKNLNAYGQCEVVNFVTNPTPAPTGAPPTTNPSTGENNCDVCAKLTNIEAQNAEILSKLQ
ncbi:hypothetical protein ACFFRR_006900 [Megaselia abdita]